MLLLLAACTPTEPTPPPIVDETPSTAPPWVDTGIYRPPDTGAAALPDHTPANTIAFEHAGYWELSGSPLDTLVGRLDVTERVNGYVPDTGDTGDVLPCDLGYFLTGTAEPTLQPCDGCDEVWRVTFTWDPASTTDASRCRDPELPTDGATWLMAWHPGDARVQFNWYGSGVWLPWWPGQRSGDRVDFEWVGTFGFDPGEEEE